MRALRLVWLTGALAAVSGCSSVYLKHPTTGDVVECEPAGWAPLAAQAAMRNSCIDRWKGRGFVVVEKCKNAPAGAPCVTDEERARAR